MRFRLSASGYPVFADWNGDYMNGNGRRADGTFGIGNRAGAGRKTLRKTARELFKSDLPTAILTVRALLKDERHPELRLQAAKLVLEHSLGRPTQRTELAADSAVESFTVNLTTKPQEELLGRLRGLVNQETQETVDRVGRDS